MKVKECILWLLIISIAIIITILLPKILYLVPEHSFLYNCLIEPLKFYDRHSGFFQIIVTGILIFITWIYVSLTRKLANSSIKHVEMAKENNELTVRPVLVLRALSNQERIFNTFINYIILRQNNLNEIYSKIKEERKKVNEILCKNESKEFNHLKKLYEELYKELEEGLKKIEMGEKVISSTIPNHYIFIKREISKLQKQLSKEEQLPVLDFIFNYCGYIRLKNVGKGPALNIVICGIDKSIPQKFFLIKEGYVIGGLAPEEEFVSYVEYKEIDYNTLLDKVFRGYEKDRNVKKLKEKRVNFIMFIYEDIFKNKFVSIHNGVGGEYSQAMEFYKLEKSIKY